MPQTFRAPTGIALSESEYRPSTQGHDSYFTQNRLAYASVDGLACWSSYVTVMEAETILVEAPPVWAVAEIATAGIALAACPVFLGADLMASDNTLQQVQSVSGVFSPAGMIGAVIGALAASDTNRGGDVGTFIGDGTLLVKDLASGDVPSSERDLLRLGADAAVFGAEAVYLLDDFFNKTDDDSGDEERSEAIEPQTSDSANISQGAQTSGNEGDDIGGEVGGDVGSGGVDGQVGTSTNFRSATQRARGGRRVRSIYVAL